MEILNPLILGGAALASAPIILHLVMRQQPRHLEFPALRFVRARSDVNRRRLRLQHLLLLLLRVAVVCFLVAALARPTLRFAGFLGDREAPAAVALVFDTSPRMTYRQANQTRLEAAEEMALSVMQDLPIESRIAVVDSSPTEPVFQVDAGSARQRIERLEVTNVSRPVSERINEALRLLERSELARKEMYIFTDLTARAWAGEQGELAAQLAKAQDLGLYVVDVGVEKPENVSLGELRLSAEVLAKKSTLQLSTELAASGRDDRRVVELYLRDANGQMTKRAERSLEVAADASAAVEFAVGGLDEGTHQGYVRTLGSDSLELDNVRFFSVEVQTPWQILIVAGAPEDEAAYNFTEALAPADYRRNGQARFVCEVISYSQLPETKLEAYDAVCLLDPPGFDDNVATQLATFVSGGGGLGVFLGPAAEPARLNTTAAQELLPGKLAMQARAPTGDQFLVTKDARHPATRKLQILGDTVPWEYFPVFRYWQFDELTPGANMVVPLAGGHPAVVERSLARGRVLTMTTTVSESPDTPDVDRWNQLWGVGAWPQFTLVNEMVLYLVGASDERLNYMAGQTALIRLDPERRFPTYLVTTPDGESLRQPPDAQQNALVVGGAADPGNYRVQAGGVGEGIDRGFSVNLPMADSDLARIDEPALREVLGETPFRLARGREEIDREVVRGRVGQELYPALILTFALVLGLEHLFSNRFYRSTARGRESATTNRPEETHAQAGATTEARPHGTS